MTVGKRLRFEVLARDGFICRYCGAGAPNARLQVDHVVPDALTGGDDRLENLVAACVDCNQGKGASPPGRSTIAQVSADTARWQTAIHLGMERRLADEEAIGRLIDAFDREWLTWHVNDEEKSCVPRPPDWSHSLSLWLARGLPIVFLSAWLSRAMGADDPWRYLCGRAWSTIREIEQEIAADFEDGAEPAGLVLAELAVELNIELECLREALAE